MTLSAALESSRVVVNLKFLHLAFCMQIHTEASNNIFCRLCYVGGLALDDMKDSLSLVSVSVCHISSSDDAVIIVPVHCDLLQNTPLGSTTFQ